MKMAMDHLSPLRHRPLHLSFDVDSMDPTLCPSTGTPVMYFSSLAYSPLSMNCDLDAL